MIHAQLHSLYTKHKPFIQVAVHMTSTAVSIAYAAATVFLYAHGLSSREYGALSVFFTVVFVISGLVDLGTQQIILARLPGIYAESREKSLIFIKSIITLNTSAAIILVGLFLVSFMTFDSLVYKTGYPLSIAVLGGLLIFVFLWRSTMGSVYLATGRVVSINVLNIIVSVSQIVCLWILYARGELTTATILISLIAVNVVLSLIFLWPVFSKWARAAMRAPVALKSLHLEMVATNFSAQQLFQLGLRSDLFLFSTFNLLQSRADYALAQKIVLTISAFIASLIQLFAAEFALAQKSTEIMALIRKKRVFLGLAAASLLLLLVVPDGLYPIFFTDKFPMVGMFTRILALVYILFAFYLFLELIILYSYKDTRTLLISNAMFLATTVLCGYVLIPRIGYTAGAIALGVGLSVGIAYRAWVWRRRMKTSEDK